MTDIFREIEEDLRREQAKKLWEKYGIYLVGVVAGVILIASAFVGWRAWESSRGATSSTRYDQIVAAAAKQTPQEAAKSFGDFAKDAAGGYAVMAHLRQAAALADAGDTKGAVAVYDEVAGRHAASDMLGGLARVKAGLLLVDTASYDEIKTRMAPLDESGNAWRNSAREIIGLSAYRAEKYAEAATNFDAIVADPGSPPGLRDRAHVMQALLAPHLPRPADKSAAPVTNAAPAQADAGPKSE